MNRLIKWIFNKIFFREERIALKYVAYSDAETYLAQGWRIAKEEDRNIYGGFTHTVLMEKVRNVRRLRKRMKAFKRWMIVKRFGDHYSHRLFTTKLEARDWVWPEEGHCIVRVRVTEIPRKAKRKRA
jgi:hypothetical protein